MKNNNEHKNNNTETYKRLINQISLMTKNDHQDQQNRQTFGNNNIIQNKQEININQNYQRNNEANDLREKQRQIFERMNQKLLNKKRNVDWSQNQNYNNDLNNRNEIDKNKILYEKDDAYLLTGGKHAKIVQILNEKNNKYQYQYQNKDINLHNNIQFQPPNNITYNNNDQKNIKIDINDNNPFQTNIQNSNDFKNNKYMQYQANSNNNNVHIKNEFPKNILENSLNNNNNNSNSNNGNNIINSNDIEGENSNSPKKSSSIVSSVIYGLLFGSFATLLLWCKNPKVREYLLNCYQNVNAESILNFLKLFLHPIDLIKSLGNRIGSFKDILKESLNYLYEFIEEYNDIWRLLGIIVLIYALWLFIKFIIRKIKKENKNKKIRGNNIQSNH